MSLGFLVALLTTRCYAETISFKLVNNCSEQVVWPAMHSNNGTLADPTLDPLTPGLSLRPGTSVQTRPLSLPWGGRIWARQFCSESGADCLIGDCSLPSCWMRSAGNTTLFEVHADLGAIHYDISLGECGPRTRSPSPDRDIVVDAFTIGMTVVPSNRQCRQLSCQAPPYLGLGPRGRPLCPVSNMIRFPTDTPPSSRPYHNVYACLSDCSLYGGAKYCCPSDASGRDLCKGANPWFKTACPDAYSYATDDATSNLFCEASNFTITFSCPS